MTVGEIIEGEDEIKASVRAHHYGQGKNKAQRLRRRNSPLGSFTGGFVGRKVGWGVAVVGFAVG